MSEKVVLHKSLTDLISKVRSAERLSFRIRCSLEDVDQSVLDSFKYYVEGIAESLSSLNDNFNIISASFFGPIPRKDSNDV